MPFQRSNHTSRENNGHSKVSGRGRGPTNQALNFLKKQQCPTLLEKPVRQFGQHSTSRPKILWRVEENIRWFQRRMEFPSLPSVDLRQTLYDWMPQECRVYRLQLQKFPLNSASCNLWYKLLLHFCWYWGLQQNQWCKCTVDFSGSITQCLKVLPLQFHLNMVRLSSLFR